MFYFLKDRKYARFDELCTRGVKIGCAVVEDANSNCCRLWIRVHLFIISSGKHEIQSIKFEYVKSTIFNRIWRITYNSLMHLFLSSGRALSKSDCRAMRSDWRLDICCTSPGAETYVDRPPWASKKRLTYESVLERWYSSVYYFISRDNNVDPIIY